MADQYIETTEAVNLNGTTPVLSDYQLQALQVPLVVHVH